MQARYICSTFPDFNSGLLEGSIVLQQPGWISMSAASAMPEGEPEKAAPQGAAAATGPSEPCHRMII